jgi:hypothetical protein
VTRWLWTAANGTVTDLSAWSSGTYVLADGTSGQLAPEYEFATQAFAGVDGAQLQQVIPQPRTTVLGIDLVASDGNELRQRVRALAHTLRPRAGIGTLTAVGDDGTSRTLPCYYRKGLEAGTYRVTRYRTALEFWAPSPWWRGQQLTVPWSLAAPTQFFPILPIRLSASTISGAVTVDLSDTDAPTYPTWTITGPGEQLTLRNDTTGASLVLNSPIGDGQTVTIQTRPGYQAVTRGGVSLFTELGSDPAMWPLIDGVNVVSALLTNTGPASRIELVADRLYSGAL